MRLFSWHKATPGGEELRAAECASTGGVATVPGSSDRVSSDPLADLDDVSPTDTVSAHRQCSDDTVRDLVIPRLAGEGILAANITVPEDAGVEAAELPGDLAALAEQLAEDAAFLSGRYALGADWRAAVDASRQASGADSSVGERGPRKSWHRAWDWRTAALVVVGAGIAAALLASGWAVWRHGAAGVGSVANRSAANTFASNGATAQPAIVSEAPTGFHWAYFSAPDTVQQADQPLVVRLAADEWRAAHWSDSYGRDANSVRGRTVRWRSANQRPQTVADFFRTTPVEIPPTLFYELNGPEQEGVLDLWEQQGPDGVLVGM